MVAIHWLEDNEHYCNILDFENIFYLYNKKGKEEMSKNFERESRRCFHGFSRCFHSSTHYMDRFIDENISSSNVSDWDSYGDRNFILSSQWLLLTLMMWCIMRTLWSMWGIIRSVKMWIVVTVKQIVSWFDAIKTGNHIFHFILLLWIRLI